MLSESGSMEMQITNIAPQATEDQMQNLFGHIVSGICYIKNFKSSCVAVTQHLTNTVFIDWVLIVIPVQGGIIPDEYKALENQEMLVPALHSIEGPNKLPPEVDSHIDGMVPNQVMKIDENNLPKYPPLPSMHRNYTCRGKWGVVNHGELLTTSISSML